MSLPTWSYSSLKTFQQCPRKYYHIKVARDTTDSQHKAALYGQEFHTAAEVSVRDETPLDPRFAYAAPMVEALKNIKGGKYCELELGLTRELTTCTFDSPDAWWHGIIDLLIVDEADNLAYMVDYKTSKNARYADTKQLDYMAAAVFAKFPKLKMIKSMLLFVVSVEFVKKNHTVEKVQDYISTALPSLKRLETALETGVWNPVSGPLCGFCPVKTCEYNRS